MYCGIRSHTFDFISATILHRFPGSFIQHTDHLDTPQHSSMDSAATNFASFDFVDFLDTSKYPGLHIDHPRNPRTVLAG